MLIIGYQGDDLDLPRQDRSVLLQTSLQSLAFVPPTDDQLDYLNTHNLNQIIPFEFPNHSDNLDIKSALGRAGNSIKYFKKIDDADLKLLASDVNLTAEEYRLKYVQPRRRLYFKMISERKDQFYGSHMGSLYSDANPKAMFPPEHPQREFLGDLISKFMSADGIKEIEGIINES